MNNDYWSDVPRVQLDQHIHDYNSHWYRIKMMISDFDYYNWY